MNFGFNVGVVVGFLEFFGDFDNGNYVLKMDWSRKKEFGFLVLVILWSCFIWNGLFKFGFCFVGEN